MAAPAIQFEPFFRKWGIRNPQYLMAPRMPSIESFFFPKDSIHHYVVYDGVSKHPASDEYFYRDIQKKIFVNHITDLADQKGQPRKMAIPVMPLVREFHIKNKRFRLTEKVETIKDENSLLTINYGFAPVGYKYVKSFYAEYYKWWNIEKTLWSTINNITNLTNRQNFIFVNLPKTLPSLARLNMFSGIFNQELVKRFNTPEYLFLLEMWKWLSEDHRTESMMGNLTHQQLKRVNIVYQESGRFILINLGELNSWRAGSDVEDQKIKIDPQALQKRFLRMLMTLMENRTVVDAGLVEQEIDSGDTSETTDQDTESEIQDQPTRRSRIEEEQTEVVPEGKTDFINLDDDTIDPVIEKTKSQQIQDLIDNLDNDLQALELIENEKDENLILVDEEENKTAKEVSISHTDKAIEFNYFNKDKTPEQRLIDLCNELADDGLMSASEYRRLINSAGNYQRIPSPYDNEKTLSEFGEIKPEDTVIAQTATTVDRETIIDKSMLSSSLLDFDERYIKNILPKDIVNMVTSAQNAGFIISKYEMEPIEDVMGKYEMHTIRIAPIQGQPSTLRFKLPAVNEDGTYQSNGVKYTLRKQRYDVPIRKIAPDRVSLSSYYGKTMVTRSDKKVNDYGNWLRTNIIAKGVDNSDVSLTNLTTGDVFVNNIDLPRSYTAISMGIRGFTAQGYNFNFDYNNRVEFFGQENIDTYEKNGYILVGEDIKGGLLLLDNNNTVYKNNEGAIVPVGTLESFIGLDIANSPVSFSQIKVFGKNIPLVLVLGYMYGLENLINVLKADVRRVASGQRLNLQDHEYAIAFSDETLVFSKEDELAAIIFAGFREYAKHIRNYSVYTFDKPNVYLNVLESNGIGIRYLREIDLMDKMFIDPITKEILTEMNEPTTFRGLIVRAAQLLLKDAHPHSLDMQFMRIRGYERFAGAIYTELVNSVRDHNSKSGKANYPIELNPYAVWKRIATDPSISLVNDINPIENLKQQEAVTYSGTGGRVSRSMTKESRAYHPNDMGVISEATVDSSDVAINTYTSANPMFVSLRGRAKKYNFDEPNPTSVLSTSALMAVGSDSDDPKRVNFINIQNSHSVSCNGYTQAPVRTGYEQVLGQRTSDLFCYAARKNGKVISKKDNSILIEYEDGTQKGIVLGRRFGAAAGLTIAHEVTSELHVGQEFKKGDIIAYNTGFFEKDILDPTNVILKNAVMAKTVLWESTQTHEDASSISRKLADKLSTKTTKIKQVVVQFEQEVKDILRPGTAVEHPTILCTIEDPLTSNAGLFDESTLDTLKMFSNQTPQAKVKGIVEKIEVFYNGEKEDMSDSLRALADASDRALASQYRGLGKRPLTGQVDEGYRIDGDPLQLDHLVIKFYLTSEVSSGVGD